MTMEWNSLRQRRFHLFRKARLHDLISIMTDYYYDWMPTSRTHNPDIACCKDQ